MYTKEKLGKVFKITSGGTPSRKNPAYFSEGDIPWVKTGDLKSKYLTKASEVISEIGLENSSAKLFPEDTVLIAMYGATIGATSILKIKAATNQACAAFLPNKNVLPDYLYYYLLSAKQQLVEKGVGGAQPNISATILKDFEIPLPPLPVQKKIAEVLDQADGLRQYDRQLLEKYDQLAQSIFLDMFGDVSPQDTRWPKAKLSQLVNEITAGKSVGGEDKLLNKGEIGVLKISSVTTGSFLPEEYKVVDQSQLDISKLVFVNKGDLLFSRANTRELVAATCVVENETNSLFLPDKLWRIKLDTSKVNKYFFKYVLTDTKYRKELTKKATGTSGSMLNISKSKLLDTLFPVPPVESQDNFSVLIKNINSLKRKVSHNLDYSEKMFQSLLQRAFKGELFPEKAEEEISAVLGNS